MTGALDAFGRASSASISQEVVMSRAQSTVYPCTKHQVRNQTEELSGLQKDHGHGWSSNIEIALIPMQRRAGMRRGGHDFSTCCCPSLHHEPMSLYHGHVANLGRMQAVHYKSLWSRTCLSTLCCPFLHQALLRENNQRTHLTHASIPITA